MSSNLRTKTGPDHGQRDRIRARAQAPLWSEVRGSQVQGAKFGGRKFADANRQNYGILIRFNSLN